jgi:hypothetical protein
MEGCVMNRVFLLIDFDAYWLHATGGAGSGDLDQVLVRDKDGIPALSGKHVSGLLRDSSRRTESWGWPPMLGYWSRAESLTELLFGGFDEDAGPGCLVFPDFRISPRLRQVPRVKEVLGDFIAATRIERGSRTASDKSLRQIEAAAPVPLGAWVRWDATMRLLQRPCDRQAVEAARQVWHRHLREACLDLCAVGGKRSRGFGRCRVVPVTEREAAEVGA